MGVQDNVVQLFGQQFAVQVDVGAVPVGRQSELEIRRLPVYEESRIPLKTFVLFHIVKLSVKWYQATKTQYLRTHIIIVTITDSHTETEIHPAALLRKVL